KTEIGTTTINDLPGAGGIMIETSSGAKMTFDTAGIEISNGQGATIKLSGPQISLNDGALEVI
ncbi:MAG TPA: baseplate assembly protein, partial [Roseiflexaceae bacterium]|nr:baseplate assembly protein [Roseiflexaceae bacterium]